MEEIDVLNDSGTAGDEGAPDNPNNFYDELLKDIPEEHRGELSDYLKKADAKVTQRFQKLSLAEKEAAKKQEQLKQYEDLGDPDSLSSYINLVNALENNPKETLEELYSIYGLNKDEQDDESPLDETELLKKKFEEHEARERDTADKRAQSEADKALDRELSELQAKNPEIEWNEDTVRYICFLASQPESNADLSKAVEIYKGTEKAKQDKIIKEFLKQKENQGPNVEGSGGMSTTGNRKEIKTLEDAKQAAKQRIAALAEQSR